jgi:hypothetical protein
MLEERVACSEHGARSRGLVTLGPVLLLQGVDSLPIATRESHDVTVADGTPRHWIKYRAQRNNLTS